MSADEGMRMEESNKQLEQSTAHDAKEERQQIMSTDEGKKMEGSNKQVEQSMAQIHAQGEKQQVMSTDEGKKMEESNKQVVEQRIAQIHAEEENQHQQQQQPSMDTGEKAKEGDDCQDVKEEEKRSEQKGEGDQVHKVKEVLAVEEKSIEAGGESGSKLVSDDLKEKNIEEKAATSPVPQSNAVLEMKNASFKEESHPAPDLKDFERKALSELRSKIEEAILGNSLFIAQNSEQKAAAPSTKHGDDQKDKGKETQTENSVEKKDEDFEGKKVAEEGEKKEGSESNETKQEKLILTDKEMRDVAEKEGKEGTSDEQGGEKKTNDDVQTEAEPPKESVKRESDEGKQEVIEEGKKEIAQEIVEEKEIEVDKDISLWGVSLLPSKGDKSTDVILLKFLRARELKVNEAFEMIRNTLQWRKEKNIDSILDEEFESDLSSAAFMDGKDREGHPICYNVFGVFGNDELYNKMLGNEEKRERFLRWRIQLMEKGIQKLDFKPDGISTIIQINDLKNTPGPTKKELRLAVKKAVELLQDNYPEFVEKNVFVNVPFWYYAFSAVLSPFLTPRTKNKFIYARASRVTDTLLKFASGEQIPVQYGGLKRETDPDFTVEDIARDAVVRASSTEIIEILATEVGKILVWDLTVCGWEVTYKEEFVPTDEKSYTIIVQKVRKIASQEGSIRNSFKNNEPGKLVITIENSAFKKKRIMYRYRTKDILPPSTSSS